MKRQGLCLVIALALASSACAAGSAQSPAVHAAAPPAGVAAELAPSMAAPNAPAAPPAAVRTADSPAQLVAPPALAKTAEDKAPRQDSVAAKPLLIYEAALGIQVRREGFAEAIERSIDVAESLGGFLLSRSDTGVALRIPSQSFRAALAELEKLGSVSRRSVSAQDVSEQYHDLEVRLKNLEAVRNRLEQFLARTANVSEALTVGKELEKVTLQIDEIKGRMQFLKTRAAYSLVRIELVEKPAQTVVTKPAPPPPRPARLPVEWLRKVGLDELGKLD